MIDKFNEQLLMPDYLDARTFSVKDLNFKLRYNLMHIKHGFFNLDTQAMLVDQINEILWTALHFKCDEVNAVQLELHISDYKPDQGSPVKREILLPEYLGLISEKYRTVGPKSFKLNMHLPWMPENNKFTNFIGAGSGLTAVKLEDEGFGYRLSVSPSYMSYKNSTFKFLLSEVDSIILDQISEDEFSPYVLCNDDDRSFSKDWRRSSLENILEYFNITESTLKIDTKKIKQDYENLGTCKSIEEFAEYGLHIGFCSKSKCPILGFSIKEDKKTGTLIANGIALGYHSTPSLYEFKDCDVSELARFKNSSANQFKKIVCAYYALNNPNKDGFAMHKGQENIKTFIRLEMDDRIATMGYNNRLNG